jgi:polyvinyl alcohol dehydrogenase (cytochrome)
MIQRSEDGLRKAIRMAGRLAMIAGLYLAALGPAACLSPVGSGSAVAGGTAGALDDPGGDWPGWPRDLRGTRHNPAETTITPSTVGGLKLKWSFVFPDQADGSYGSQPAVVGETLYVGSPDANLYALDARTGSTKWVFDRTAIAGPAGIRNGPVVADGKVIFGDTRGYLYALNASTGRLVWSLRLGHHVATTVPGSAIVFDGKVYVGVSSGEEGIADDASYPCCTFRGQLVALSLATGTVLWRRYTVPPAALAGKWPNGAARYEPAGGAVWSTPAVDPASRTIFYGTGNNYTGTTGDHDSVVALNADTGALRWKRQMTHPDVWTTGCFGKPIKHCPGLADGTNFDHDFGAAPNVFTVNGRTLVGIGQKSGVYHAFDAATGRTVWQRPLSIPEHNGGSSGIPWGSSYDGRRIYVATWRAKPGTLFALDPATGEILWRTPNPADGCTTGGAAAHPDQCNRSHISAVTTTPGLVYEGSADGKMRIYGARDGAILWQYDTVREYKGVNGATGSGGSIAGNGGAVVAHGMLYVKSGYYPWFGIRGRVLLAFGL